MKLGFFVLESVLHPETGRDILTRGMTYGEAEFKSLCESHGVDNVLTYVIMSEA